MAEIKDDLLDGIPEIILKASKITLEGPSIGKEYIALLWGGKIRRIGVLGYMNTLLFETVLVCLVASQKSPDYLYIGTVAPGAVLAPYNPELFKSLSKAFKEAQEEISPVIDEVDLPIDMKESYLMPVAAC